MNFFFKNKKIFITIYFIIIFFLCIYANKKHNEQNIEHFHSSVMKQNEKKKQYSDCKKKCLIKHSNNQDILVCKTYCKCKKKCKDKKCKKKCKDIKMNLHNDDPEKIKRIQLKEDIKQKQKKEKKQEIKDRKLNILKKQEKTKEENSNKISIVDVIVENYFTQAERDTLFSTNNNLKLFFKDCKKVLRLK